MDLEAPVDAWYVYIATAIISVALAGLVLGISTGPPPDAPEASNAIEGVTGSEYVASASYEHDANTVTINRQTITMENDHGTAHSSFSYGTVVPVNGDETLEDLVYGESFEEAFQAELDDPHIDGTAEFFDRVESADAENTGEELSSNGELIARTIAIEEDSTVSARARARPEGDVSEGMMAEFEDVPVPNEIRINVEGNGVDSIGVAIDAEPLEEHVEESSDGILDTAIGALGSIYSWASSTVCGSWNPLCGSGDAPEPDIVSDHTTSLSHDGLISNERIDLFENLADVDDEDDLEEIWLGAYDVDIELTLSGSSEMVCEGRITEDESEEWVHLCGPDLTLDDFDDPHWHDDRGGVHYVTLVIV